MRVGKYLLSGLTAVFFAYGMASCGGEKLDATKVETTSSGNVAISVDEGYRPVIEQQLKVFDSSYPEAHIQPYFKPEKQCFDDLFKDSSGLILTSRDLTDEEKRVYHNNGVQVRSLAVAMDAIAIVVNPKSQDSFMTVGQLKEILTGGFVRPYTIVFDNPQSSTVRYIMDTLIPGKQLSSKSYAVKNNEAVIDYVSKNENAIGILSMSYAYDPESTTELGDFRNNVKVVSLRNDSTGEFYQPYLGNIALQEYPLTRKLYFITRDGGQGLSAGFANFICSERGQLIFKKSRLVPLRVQLTIRAVEIK